MGSLEAPPLDLGGEGGRGEWPQPVPEPRPLPDQPAPVEVPVTTGGAGELFTYNPDLTALAAGVAMWFLAPDKKNRAAWALGGVIAGHVLATRILPGASA